MTHHRSTGTLARAAAAIAGAALLQGANAAPPAGPLADPTRPPAALSAPGGLAAAALPHQANRDTARAIAAAQRAAEPPAAPPAPLLVQAVQLPTSGAAVALVDGRPVKVGEQVDSRTVLAIDAQGLLVKGPRGPERLWLLGSTAKQTAGSITQGQTARYQPAPQAAPQTLAGAAEVGDTQATPPNTTTSTAPTPLSLARRTAP